MKDKFTVLNENNEEVTYDVLFTFQNEETNNDYVVYTDNSKDSEGNTQVFASIYHPDSDNDKLEEITSEKEWKVIDTILKTIQEELKENNG